MHTRRRAGGGWANTRGRRATLRLVPGDQWAGVGALVAALTLTSCHRWDVRPECRVAYRNCTDGCAAQCDPPAGFQNS